MNPADNPVPEQTARLKGADTSHVVDYDAPEGTTPERVEDCPACEEQEPRPERCPRCSSPAPHLHPAMQADGGEVQPCAHPFHQPAPRLTAADIAEHDDGTITAQELRRMAHGTGEQAANAPSVAAMQAAAALLYAERFGVAPDVRTTEASARADEAATVFVPPAHFTRDDGTACCVHTIPVGPGSCLACWDLAKWDVPGGEQA